jgi:MoxR-like ATPase
MTTRAKTQEDTARLEGMVPPKELADAYINRKIFGKEDFAVFDWARDTKRNLLVKGPTQAAKTLALRAYAAARRLPCVTVDVGAAMDPALTLGTYRRTPSGQLEWYDGLLTLAWRWGDSVAVLDECNMAHPKVMAAYHPMGDNRRHIPLTEVGEVVKAGAGVLLAATMNPDYIGTTPIGEAFSARFQHIPWDYDPTVEKTLLAPSVRKVADKLRDSEYVHTPVSTHILMQFQDTIQEMGYDFAKQVFSASFSTDEGKGITYAFDAGLDDEIRAELG